MNEEVCPSASQKDRRDKLSVALEAMMPIQ